MKSILFVVSQSPYQSFLTQEFIDSILFAGSYGLNVSVLFTGAGIKQLVKHETVNKAAKNTAKQIAAFEHFDIQTIYVTEHDYNLQEFVIPVIHTKLNTEFTEQFNYVIYDDAPCQK